MRTIIKKTKVFKFCELSQDAKETVIETFSDINTDYQWWDFLFEDFKTVGEILGIEINEIYFSGFWSQGDGACFEGNYSYKKDCIKKIKEYAPTDTELHSIATALFQIQRPYFYRLTANIKHSGHYYHEYCTAIDVYQQDNTDYGNVSSNDVEAIEDLLRDFMRWMYQQLEKEYNWLTTKEQIISTIESNNYEFTEDGQQYY